MKERFFAHPHTLLNQIHKTLEDVGSQNFFKSSDENVKKAREAFAVYFFLLAMKKWTGRDWWLFQPDQKERPFPDFDFMSLSEDPRDIKIEPVELTGVYPHFKSFDEVIKVVKEKQEKYGNESKKFSLLVFVNHEKSEEWINLLKNNVSNKQSFLSLWTLHLLFKKGGKEVGKAVAQRIAPLPNLRIEVDTNDSEIYKSQVLPLYTKQCFDGEKNFIKFKNDFLKKLRKLKNNEK